MSNKLVKDIDEAKELSKKAMKISKFALILSYAAITLTTINIVLIIVL